MDFSQLPGLGRQYLTVRILISMVDALPYDPNDDPKVALRRIKQWLPNVRDRLAVAEKDIDPLRLELATVVGVSITSKLFPVARYIAGWDQIEDKRTLANWPLIVDDIKAERDKLPPYDEAVAIWESEVAKLWAVRGAPTTPSKSLIVDLATRVATLDGKRFQLDTEHQARYVKAMGDREGAFITTGELEKIDHELAGVRHCDMKDKLPAAIADRIESKQGSGARFCPKM